MQAGGLRSIFFSGGMSESRWTEHQSIRTWRRKSLCRRISRKSFLLWVINVAPICRAQRAMSTSFKSAGSLDLHRFSCSSISIRILEASSQSMNFGATTRPVRCNGSVKSSTKSRVLRSFELTDSSYATTAERKVLGSRGKKTLRKRAFFSSERKAPR